MPYKIAVPENIIYRDLFSEGLLNDENGLFQIFEVSEQRLSDLMFDNRVDLALMTPISFGKGVGLTNYLILPTKTLALEGFTGIASFFFKQTTKRELSCSSTNPDDFLMIIGKILLGELYGLHPEIKKVNGEWKELLEKSDIAMTWGTAPQKELTLDISEEWYLHYGYILPIAFWVCRDEDNNRELLRITQNICQKELVNEIEIIEDTSSAGIYQPRKGKIIYQWKSEIKEALEHTLKILYYHQYIDEIPEVNVFKEDL